MISHRRRRLSFVSSSAQEPRCPPASLEPEMLSNRFQCRAFCWLAIKYCTNAVRRVPTRCENKQPASSVVVKYCTNTSSAIKLQFTRASLSRLSNATMESNECYCWRLIAPISLRKSVTIVNTSHKWKTLQNVAKLIFMEVSESVVSPE